MKMYSRTIFDQNKRLDELSYRQALHHAKENATSITKIEEDDPPSWTGLYINEEIAKDVSEVQTARQYQSALRDHVSGKPAIGRNGLLESTVGSAEAINDSVSSYLECYEHIADDRAISRSRRASIRTSGIAAETTTGTELDISLATQRTYALDLGLEAPSKEDQDPLRFSGDMTRSDNTGRDQLLGRKTEAVHLLLFSKEEVNATDFLDSIKATGKEMGDMQIWQIRDSKHASAADMAFIAQYLVLVNEDRSRHYTSVNPPIKDVLMSRLVQKCHGSCFEIMLMKDKVKTRKRSQPSTSISDDVKLLYDVTGTQWLPSRRVISSLLENSDPAIANEASRVMATDHAWRLQKSQLNR